MKKDKGQLTVGVLLLMAALLNVLNIDYAAYDWLNITPPILFAIGGILSIRQYIKQRKTENEFQ